MTNASDRYIARLGGTAAVARARGVPLATVAQWRRDGIPAMQRRRLTLIEADLIASERAKRKALKPRARRRPFWDYIRMMENSNDA